MTSPFLQLIVASQRSCAARGGEFTLANVPPPVEEAFALLGMANQLAEWRK